MFKHCFIHSSLYGTDYFIDIESQSILENFSHLKLIFIFHTYSKQLILGSRYTFLSLLKEKQWLVSKRTIEHFWTYFVNRDFHLHYQHCQLFQFQYYINIKHRYRRHTKKLSAHFSTIRIILNAKFTNSFTTHP